MNAYGRPPLVPTPAQAVFEIQGRWINLEPLDKDTSIYVLCRSFIHNDLHKRKLPERQQLASFTKEAGKFAFLLKEHPPTVTSVPKLIARKSRSLRKSEILNSARNMPAPQLLRSHLAYCRELKKGSKAKRKVLNQHAATRLKALKEQFAGHMKKRKALVLSSRDPVVVPSTSTLMSAAQTLAASGLSTSLADSILVSAPHAKQSRPNALNA